MSKLSISLFSLISIVTFLSFSCTSVPYNQKEDSVLKLVKLINDGKITEVNGLSQTPFVLDSETLYLESDVATMWKNLKKASFIMSDARFVRTEHLTANTYKMFADTFDMKNYFEKYTGKHTSAVTIETSEGKYYLLLDRKIKGYPRIQGLKGPIQ